MLDDLCTANDPLGSGTLSGVRAQSNETLNGFCPGATVRTAFGDAPIEALRIGDMVCTRNSGLQPIRHIEYATLASSPKSRPVRLAAGTLNARQDILCGPRQRILIEGPLLELYKGLASATAQASSIVNGASITRVSKPIVHYIDIQLARADIIFVEDVRTVASIASGTADPAMAAASAPKGLSHQDCLVIGAML